MKSKRFRDEERQALQYPVKKSLEERARERVDELGFTETQKEFIFADWPEGDEHFIWLLTATRDEIESWVEAGEWGIIRKEE